MYLVCITGASSVILGIRLIEELVKANFKVKVIISKDAWSVIHQEIFESQNINKIIDILKKPKKNGRFKPAKALH